MKKKIPFFFIFFYFSIFLFSQEYKYKVDSILNILSKPIHDTVKVDLYTDLEGLLYQHEPERALKYAEKALEIAKQINWKKGIALAYNIIGSNYNDRSIHDKALENYFKSLEYSTDLVREKLMTLHNIILIYTKEQNFKMALKYNNQILEIAEKEKSEKYINLCWKLFGDIYSTKAEYNKAEEYYKKSLKYWEKNNDYLNQAILLTNLGEITKDYNLKINYYLKAKKLFNKDKDNFSVSSVYNLLALSRTYMELAFNDSLRNTVNINKSKKILIQETEEYLNNAIKYSEQSEMQEGLSYAYELIGELRKNQKDYKSAYEYNKKSYTLKDSIFSQESKNRMSSLETEKEIALKNKEIEFNTLVIKTKEKQKWFYIIGIVFLIGLTTLLFIQNNLRKRTNIKLNELNKELTEANETKARFFGILNHDLRSPVASLISFLYLKKEPDLLDKEKSDKLEQKIISAAENLLISMEDIFLWSKDQMQIFKPIIKDVSVEDIFKETERYFFGYDGKIDFIFNVKSDLKINTDENYLKAIMRNLTSNAVKALKNTDRATIEWKAIKENNKIIIAITDNGSGLTQDKIDLLFNEYSNLTIKNGLGLQIIKDLSKKINCIIKVISIPDKGTTFQLIFE